MPTWEELSSTPPDTATDWDSLSTKPPGKAGVLEEIGRGLAHGAQVTLPKSIGQALQFAGQEGSKAQEVGRSMVENANARENAGNQESAYGQSLTSPFSVRGNVYEAADNSVLSMAPGAAGAAAGAGIGAFVGGVGALPGALIGYGVGSIAALPIFYGSQGEQSYENIKAAQLKAGATPEEAELAARKGGHLSGSIEAGGEAVADIIPFHSLFKPFAKVGAKAGGNMVKSMLTPTAGQFAKAVGITEAGEISTEMAQQAGEDSVEGYYGSGPGATMENTSRVIMPTALMSLIPGGAGAGAHHIQMSQMSKALQDPNTPEEDRSKIAASMVSAMGEESPEKARAFSLYAGTQIANGAPIEIKDDSFYEQFAHEAKGGAPVEPSAPVRQPDHEVVSNIQQSGSLDEAIQKASDSVSDPSIDADLSALLEPTPVMGQPQETRAAAPATSPAQVAPPIQSSPLPDSVLDQAIREASQSIATPVTGAVAKTDVDTGLIVTAAGVPYKTEAGAALAMRTKGPEFAAIHQVVPHPDGGFAIAKNDTQPVKPDNSAISQPAPTELGGTAGTIAGAASLPNGSDAVAERMAAARPVGQPAPASPVSVVGTGQSAGVTVENPAVIPAKPDENAQSEQVTPQSGPVFGTNSVGKITLRGVPREKIQAVRDKLKLQNVIIGQDSAVFPKGTDLKTLQAEFGVVAEKQQPKAKKKQAASTDLLQRIKQLGGINSKYASDVTGEQKPKGAWKFAFGKNGLGLDDLASQLAAEGFNIDLNDHTDNGGVNQLSEMIRQHIGGERAFKATTQEAKAETAAQDREYEAMRQRAEELGISVKGLGSRELADAIYSAEDAIQMDAIAEREALEAEATEINALADMGDIPFGDEVQTDDAALAAFLGEEHGKNDQSGSQDTGKGAGEQTQESAGRSADTEFGQNQTRSGVAQETGHQGGQPAGGRREAPAVERPLLESYTNADVLKREAAKAKAEEEAKAAEAKSKADKEAENFTLTGSNRAADIGAAHGQTDIFSAPETKAKKLEVLKAQAQGKISGDQGAALKELADAGEHAAVDEVLKTSPAANLEKQENLKQSPSAEPGEKLAENVQVEHYTLSAHEDMQKRVREGTISAAEFKASFDALLKNKDGIIAELDKFTKPQLFEKYPGLAYRYKNEKKAVAVEAVYDGMLAHFNISDKGISYSLTGKNSYENAMRSKVESTTDEDLAKYAENVKKNKADREAARAEALAGMADPQTLEDFNNLMRAKAAEMGEGATFQQVRMTLPLEQRIKYDELAAEHNRAARKDRVDQQKTDVRVAEQTTDGQVIETKHTKTGEPLFVVKAAERVERDVYNHWNTTAKRMGGWYSSYRGGGAVPGFQFKTRENADAFLSFIGGNVEQAKEAVQARRDAYADDRSQTAVERLTEMADALDEKADASLNQERKANTARRARFAASAEASANADKALAQTMRNIAAGIENGTAKMLDRVRQKVQVEALQGFVRTAFQEQFPRYADQEKNQPSVETADYAKYPSYTAYRSDLASLGRTLLEVEGTMKLGQRLMKVADDVSDAYLKFAKDNLLKVSAFSTKDGGRAAFPNKASAEASIARSGYKGTAIVLPIKRNENLIILSPSEAIKRGIWEGDNDKRITLSPEFGEELVEKIGKAERRGSKVSVPWQLENAYTSRKRLAGMNIETPAELRAALREFIGLRETAKEPDKIKQMERAMIGRKNDGFDFFPTPSAAADDAIAAADIKEGMTVYEPQAGMGHIADRIREAGVEPDVGEIATDRRELLEAKGYNIVSRDFLDMRIEDTPNGEGYDRIIMNPPFSDRRDAMHVQHAYSLLKPGGRLVSIMGEGVFFGKDKKAEAFREWMDKVGGTDEKLEPGTFMDPSLPVNTGVSARMVVIDKPEKTGSDAPLASRSLPKNKLYSQLSRQIEAAPDRVFQTGKQVALWLQSNASKLGIKKDEMFWSGVLDWLNTQGKISKADVLAYLDGNGVQVTEIVLGELSEAKKKIDALALKVDRLDDIAEDRPLTDKEELDRAKWGKELDDLRRQYPNADTVGETKFASYQLPGGENYRELLLNLPVKGGLSQSERAEFELLEAERKAGGINPGDVSRYNELSSRAYRDRQDGFRSSHFDQPNILAHIRFNERTDAEGRKVLFLEEIQSDWGQKGKKEGFDSARKWTVEQDADGKWFVALDGRKYGESVYAEKTDAQAIADSRRRTAPSGITPSAPFVTDTKSWTALALKRMITYAAENGFDRVAWTTGEQQAARYDLSKQVDSIHYANRPEGYLIKVIKSAGGQPETMGSYPESQLEEVVGKEVAKKIIANEGLEVPRTPFKSLSGIDLKVGGEGMKGYYDQIVPQVANDILKKMGGGKVERVSINARPKVEYTGGNAVVTYPDGRVEKYDTTSAANAVADAYVADTKIGQPGFTITPELRSKVLSEGISLFSQSGKKSEGMTSERVKLATAKLRSEWRGFVRINVVQSVREVPNELYLRALRALRPIDDTTEGLYDPETRTVYLIADNLATPQRAVWVAAHEVGGHGGIRMLGGLVKDALDHAAKNSFVTKLAKAIAADRAEKFNPREHTDEAIAELAAATITGQVDNILDRYGVKVPVTMRSNLLGMIRRVVEAVRAFFSKVFGKPVAEVSDSDIYKMIRRQKYLVEGRDLPAFSDDYSAPARSSNVRQPAESFARMATEEFVAENDPVFIHKVSSSKSLSGCLEDVADAEYHGEHTRADERDDSGADHRYVFTTDTGYTFYVFETDSGKVWINVLDLEGGGGGQAIYAAVANYAYNTGKKFIGDPAGLTADSVIRRTSNMLSSALRFGTTKHLDAAKEQIDGDLKNGVEPLDWRGNDVDKVEALAHTFVKTVQNIYPAIKGYRYDFNTEQFIDPRGNPISSSGSDGWLLPILSSAVGRVREYDGQRVDQPQVIGARSARRAIFLQSLVSAGGDSVGERSRVLEKILRWGDSTTPENLQSLFSRSGSRSSIIGNSGRAYTPAQQKAMERTGSVVTKQSLKDTLSALWQDAGKKAAQGIFDQFRPVRDIDTKAYTLLRLSKGATGAFEAMMHYGKLKIVDGATDADQSGGVLERVFYPIGKESTDFLRWVAGNRAERLKGIGREHLFTDEDIAAFKSLADGTADFDYTMHDGTVTRDRTKIYTDTLKKFNEFNRNVLDITQESGLIDPESRALWEHEFYVPFYRVSEDKKDSVRSMNIKGGVVRQEAFKKLKGGKEELNDLMANTLMNWAHLIDASAKNRAAKATIEAAEKMGSASPAEGGKNTVWYMDKGKKVEYQIDDPYLLVALNSLEYAGIRNFGMNAASTMKHWLTVGVTASPFFKVRNLVRDSVQAIATADLNYNPAGNVKEGFKLTDKKNVSQKYVSALAGGGLIRFGTMLEGNEASRVRQLIKNGATDEHILDNESKVKAMYDKYIEPAISAYNELGNRGEEVNRMALYSQLVDKGMSHADASLMARDLMDFSMQGSWNIVRFFTQIVPFMNARLQGLYKLGRAAKEDKARFAAVTGAVALASLALLAAYSDDDDWKKREDWDRDNFWWFKIGGVAFRIPKPFEIGAIATLAERSAEYMTQDEMTGKRFASTLKNNLSNQLSMNPMPQLVKPIIDVYANTDSFTGRPIETMGMEKLAPDYRYNQGTSMVARGISTAGNAATFDNFLSPVQVDHMLRGYFGWLGSFCVGGADMMVRSVMDEPTKPTVDYWKMATGGIVADLDGAQSRYVTQMYEQAKELEQAYGTYRNLLKTGKPQEAAEYRAEHAEELQKYKNVENVKKAIAKLNERIKLIERSAKDPDEKRTMINQLRGQQDKIARVLH